MPDIKIYGNITLAASPTDGNDLVTKGYVDALAGGGAKSVTTLSTNTIEPASSGQVFYENVASATTLSFSTNAIVCEDGNIYEFYLLIKTVSSAVTFPSAWTWAGGTAPSTTGGGLFVFHIFSVDNGSSWFAERKNISVA